MDFITFCFSSLVNYRFFLPRFTQVFGLIFWLPTGQVQGFGLK
ncbi:hypothetical protein N0824_02903 [Microcystis sp. 0824]|nr:hypothetical protein N0824_02903 [Microcystis sp. 0824]